MELRCIDTPELDLAEGTVYLREVGILCFVDILKGTVHAYSLKEKWLKSHKLGCYTGFLVPYKDSKVVAVSDNKLVILDVVTGEKNFYCEFELLEGVRFNDGKCDRDGRLWAGTMALDQSRADKGKVGSLFCIEKDKIVYRIDNMTIPNGMAWEGEDVFYHTDTTTLKITEYVQKGNKIQRKRTALDFTGFEGHPDGCCIDSENMIWTAMWGGSCVLRCDPHTGKVISKVQLPDKRVSCCTFGGDDCKTLFITTARDEEGNGGHLYSLSTDTVGTYPYSFRI